MKDISNHVRFAVLVIVICLLSGCQAAYDEDISGVAEYATFIPKDDYPIRLEFEYPTTWIRKDSGETYSDFFILTFLDPRTTIPENTADLHFEGYGYVAIMIDFRDKGNNLSDYVDVLIKARDKNSYMTFLNKYDKTVAGIDAQVVEYMFLPNGIEYASETFSQEIFFFVDGNLMSISFEIANDERFEDFENGYHHFIDSIQVLSDEDKEQ